MATITCPYCKARSHVTYRHSSAFRVSDDPFVVVAAFTCDECRRIVSAAAQTSPIHQTNKDRPDHLIDALLRVDEAEWDWQPKTVLGKDFPDIPTHIGAAADEAFQCFSIQAYRAAVLMARSVIEASAKDKGITTGTLLAKIDKLAEQSHIRAMLAEAAHEVRLAGNDMAHGDFATADIVREDADEILGLMEDFLREMFELPTRVARRQAKRTPAE